MDEETPQAGTELTDGEPDSPVTDDKTASELERARRDAAKYRTQLRETQAHLSELQPLAEQFREMQEAQKSETQKALDHAAAVERENAELKAAAERATKEAAITRMATKAGIDPDLVPFLDLSKLDLEDEESVMGVLGKLAAPAKATQGGASNPVRGNGAQESDDDRRARLFERGSRSTMFGR